jgi:hypothetical protein
MCSFDKQKNKNVAARLLQSESIDDHSRFQRAHIPQKAANRRLFVINLLLVD